MDHDDETDPDYLEKNLPCISFVSQAMAGALDALGRASTSWMQLHGDNSQLRRSLVSRAPKRVCETVAGGGMRAQTTRVETLCPSNPDGEDSSRPPLSPNFIASQASHLHGIHHLRRYSTVAHRRRKGKTQHPKLGDFYPV